MTTENKQVLLPSLRAKMGDWWYYVTTMTFADVSARVVQVDKIHERRELKSWIQRKIDPKRLDNIAQYLLHQEQRFFNGIVVGIYGGEPEWFPVSIGESQTLEIEEPDDRTETALGLLKLSGSEEIFAIDGQHRVEGIKVALESNSKLSTEEQCVIFVAHHKTDEGRKRTRRLFFTLNRYAAPVSRGELIALSEDDSFAIVTRQLVDEYEYLSSGLAEFTTETNIPSGNKRCLTTVLSLYDIVKTIAIPRNIVGSRERRMLEASPPNEKKVKAIYKQQCEFWDALRQYVPAIKEITESDEDLAGNYRRNDGGHVLFRPVGQKPFARAVRVLIDRGSDLKPAVEALSKTVLNLESPPWSGVLWNPTAHKVITSNETLAQNLFLYMIGQEPVEVGKSYDLEKAYQKALDNEQAKLKTIPVKQFSIKSDA